MTNVRAPIERSMQAEVVQKVAANATNEATGVRRDDFELGSAHLSSSAALGARNKAAEELHSLRTTN